MSASSTSSSNSTRRAWKLQEFVAHGAQVNCLSLGHRSGRVLVTGGDDKKVNLWAVGKPNCIMSLTGHSSPIEAVRFGHTEESVCAGSQAGTLKIWDLEAARLVRTHTGHKASISCIEFHPYGEYLASGSLDACLKLWDTRRKGCIFSYRGHAARINALKFSPDGQWIASAGEEGTVRLWDLRAGKLLTELGSAGGGPIYDVEFHPHEFLLAGGSQDRTVHFWDLEKFAPIGAAASEDNPAASSSPATGPVRCIYFHPEGECLFSGTVDGLRVHGWEPTRTFDSLGLGWGRLADLATASHQLIGASFSQCHVALYVVDLKRVQPFCGVNIPEKEPKESGGVAPTTGSGVVSNGQADPHKNVTFRPGQTVRRSFVREKPGTAADSRNGKSSTQPSVGPPQVKISEETSDKSGTEGEDSDAVSHADIPDINHYETIFRPRNRELNRTPPADEPFEAPSGGSELEMLPMPVRAADPTAFYGSSKLLAKKGAPVVSPSPPTRRASQPAMYSATAVAVAAVPGGLSQGGGGSGSRRGSTTGLHPPDIMRPQEVHLRGTAHSGAVVSPHQRPYSVYGGEGVSGENSRGSSGRTASVPRELGPPPGSPVRAAYRTAIPLGASEQLEEYLPDSLVFLPPQQAAAVPYPGSPASPSRHYPAPASPVKGYPPSYTGGPPLDRPTAVRPHRASEGNNPYYYYQQQQQRGGLLPQPQQQQQQSTVEEAAVGPVEDQKLIPSMADRPSGLNTSDFLPQKFGGLKIGLQPSTSGSSRNVHHSPQHQGFDWPVQLSESEVTSSILRDHTNIEAVLRSRHRHLEIIRQLWQTKDAKTAVEQAVDYADQAVIVDLLSVIVLRPSIWNLDLCLHLLPPLAELLLSKYESYVAGAATALKLILKNFGTVIRSNIDSPSTSVGVDISKEERLNKCLDCYRELVKIRSVVLKRQTLQGKCGHAFRELAILMQVLD